LLALLPLKILLQLLFSTAFPTRVKDHNGGPMLFAPKSLKERLASVLKLETAGSPQFLRKWTGKSPQHAASSKQILILLARKSTLLVSRKEDLSLAQSLKDVMD